MGWVMMDERELHRIGVLSEIQTGNRTIASGAAVLGLTARHIRRLLDRYEQLGASGLAHGLQSAFDQATHDGRSRTGSCSCAAILRRLWPHSGF